VYLRASIRQCAEERNFQAKLLGKFDEIPAIGPVPGDDRIECTQFLDELCGGFGYAEQVEASGRDCARLVRNLRQNRVLSRSPGLQIVTFQAFQGGQRHDKVPNRPRPDHETAHLPSIPKRTPSASFFTQKIHALTAVTA
jgi:hypothetical protein